MAKNSNSTAREIFNQAIAKTAWPSVSEINDAKSRGMQVVPATLTLHHPEAA